MLRAKFVNIFKRDDLFFRGHIFCYNIAALCCRLERGLPYTKKQTIVIYSISLHSYFIFRHASNLVDCFDHISSAFHVDYIYHFNFFTQLSCTGNMTLLDGAGILLPKQSLRMLLGPIGVCVRATLSPTLAEAAFRPRFPLSTSSYKLKPGDLYLHLSHATFSRQHSPHCCSVVKSKLRFPGHFGRKSLCS